jgi:hypothetical protein
VKRPIVQRAIATHHAAAQLVELEEVGSEREATPVSLAAFGVD